MQGTEDSRRPRRTLVIPMFREAERIPSTLAALRAAPVGSDGTELVLVDDGSDDGTADVVEAVAGELGLEVSVVRLGVNRGKGAAVRAGMLAARGATVAFADADLSAGVEAIESVFEAVEAGQGDVVVASRTHPGSRISVHQPRTRQLAGKSFNVGLRALGLTGLKDTQCGLKAFTAEAARELFGDLGTEGFAFDVEVLARAARRDLRVAETPVEWRHVEASRVSPLGDGLRMARDAVRVRARLAREGSRPAPAGMATASFDAMARVERDHWWFRAKRRLVLDALEAEPVARRHVLDVGCGTGALLGAMEQVFKVTVGSDLEAHALGLCRRAVPDGMVVRARAEALPFRSGTFDAVTCLDVVEHLDDDVAALGELHRLVADDGLALVAVPAYQWAWSDHDDVLGHRRRYTRRRLVAAVGAAGWSVERATYFHAWLVLPALLLRRTPLRRLVKGSAEEASFVGPAVNRWLERVTAVERAVQRLVPLPFGLSVFVVARRR